MDRHFDKMSDHLKLPLTDILAGTNNFADENIIRSGGFGKIYKGQLSSSGELIDIVARRLDRQDWQGDKEFRTEIFMLARLKHPNLVSIVGFCDENGEKIIINKYEAKGSLDRYLSDPVTLTWTQRLKICVGMARALSYIHYDQGRSFSVIHRNIKSSKILLGDKWEPKLSGFGLSTMQPADRRHGLVLDVPCGTPGYLEPTSTSVSHKSDIFSFGVVLIEILSGREILMIKNGIPLFRSNYENEKLNEIIHPGLQKQIESQSLKVFSEAAYCCLNDQRAQRPHIDRVIIELDKALELQLALERSALAVHGTLTNYWKEKDLEHLKIELDDIKVATENFNEKYYIGSGGYGVVYKAELEHFDFTVLKGNEEGVLPKKRSTVAIKYITNRKDTLDEQGFITEIETLSSCKHPNIVSLLGFCYEHPHMILVYEHVSKGSLDDYLGSEGKMTNLTWMQRIKICIDIARGLDYIHTTMDYKQKIIHRDIKSANILLGGNWEAKIADFGLSKLHPLNQTKSTINTNNVAGTLVYLDPEYESTGNLKKESDVYSFGVVLFEILTGRLAYDPVYTNEDDKGLAPIVRRHFEKGTLIKEMVDPKLKEENAFTLNKGPDKDSLHIFSKIGYQCLAETQAQRPTMKVIINELEKALNFQETHKDSLRMSLDDIRLATNNFDRNNMIGKGGFGRVYKGEILLANGSIPIAVKRWDDTYGQGDREFLVEIEILFEYKHENIINLVGYCNENNEKIIVYEYASNQSLDRHLGDASLTWTDRLKISIDVAVGLDFLHGGGTTQAPVRHRDIKSANILIKGDWRAKISDFGMSMIIPLNNEFNFVVDIAFCTAGYDEPQYIKDGSLTRESDIYSLGVVFFELLCGRVAVFEKDIYDRHMYLASLVTRHYKEEGNFDKLVFKGIKDKTVQRSLNAFVEIAYECLHEHREKRPTAGEIVLQLKKALEFQEDIEIWESKLPTDYKEIVQMSKTPEIYSNKSNKDLYNMFSKGILLQEGKVCLSLNGNEQWNEMVSATMFSYENHILHKRRCLKKSRFQRVVKMLDISILRIQIKIKTQFLSPNVIYGAYLVFKFCDPRKISSKLMYVNLNYRMGSQILHAYFASCGDDEWMITELCRFIPHKKDVDFEVQLESLSRYYCGSGAIYVEGIHFKAMDDSTLKVKPEVEETLNEVETVLKSNPDSVPQVPVDYQEITQLDIGEKFSQSKANENKCHVLPAKMVLYKSSDMKCYNWKSVGESSFQEVAEILSHPVFQVKCKIETQRLSADTDYACYLIFKLSQKCHGLHCPVKARDLLLRNNKAPRVLYFRSPRVINFHGDETVIPKQREDGLMEVIVWEFNSGNKLSDTDHLPMNLKLICYEGTMSGLLVYGIEFRPI